MILENKKYQDVMSHLEVTPEMKERLLKGISDMEENEFVEDVHKMENVHKIDNVASLEDRKTRKRSVINYRRVAYAAAACALLVVGGFFGAAVNSPSAGSSYKYDSQPNYAQTEETADYYDEPADYNNESGSDDYSGDIQEIDGDTLGYESENSLTAGAKSAAKPGDTAKPDVKTDTADPAQQSDQKLIYTSQIHIETEAYKKSIEDLKTAIQSAGGYIESENESASSYGSYSYDYSETGAGRLMRNDLVIRIPTSKYNSFMEGMSEIGFVVSKSQNVDNVTSYYHDTEVHIKALKIQEKRLLAMMDKADTIEDMIRVERRLTEVQTELDSYEGTLKGLDNQVDYATVNLTLNEVKKYTESPEAGFFEKAKSRLAEGFENFGENVINLILAILYLLPMIILVLVLVIIIRFFMKKTGRTLSFKGKKTKDIDPDVFKE